jgi:hypothetical protein
LASNALIKFSLREKNLKTSKQHRDVQTRNDYKQNENLKFMNYLKSALICLLGLISINTMAQTEMRTLFGKSKNKIQSLGFYIAPELSYGQFSGSFAPIAGNSVMLIVNKKFAIGATASGTIRNNNTSSGQFGGLKMEFTPKPDALVHVSFPLVIGAGSISTRGSFGDFDRHGRNDDKFEFNRNGSFVLQPGVNVEANVFKYAKVFLGANYRLSANESGYNTDLSGFASSLGLKFGVFDYKLKKKSKQISETVEEVK